MLRAVSSAAGTGHTNMLETVIYPPRSHRGFDCSGEQLSYGLSRAELPQNFMIENTPTFGRRTEIVNSDLCTTEGIRDLQMQTQGSTKTELMCHIITNSLSLNKVIHQLGSTACCHGTCLIFGANKNWSFKSPCEVRALKFFPIKHLLIPHWAPQLVTLTQNIFIIKRPFEISAHRFQRRIIIGKNGTIKSLLQFTLSCSWWNQELTHI